MKSGNPETSWQHCVGSYVDSCSRVRIPSMADLKSSFLHRKTCWDCNFGIALHGDMRPFLAGIAVNTWCIFAMINWNLSNGMPMLLCLLERSLFWRIVRSFCCLFSLSHSICLYHQNQILAKSSSSISYFLLSSFFWARFGHCHHCHWLERSWIPCMVAFATCSICPFVVGMTIAIKSSM